VLGFAIAATIGTGPTATSGELQELYVVPEARRRGIGRRLAEDAVGWLRTCGRTIPIRVLVGHDADEGASRILASLGFEQHAAAWGQWVT
jgi:GNAT superfamily N-acetyltransferase